MVESKSPSLPPTGQAHAPIPRRVPVAVLRPRLEVCAATGVEIDETSRILVVGDEGGAGAALAGRLRELGAQVLVLAGGPADRLTRPAQDFAAGGPLQGVYFLSGLDGEPSLAEMSTEDWRTQVEQRADALFSLLQALGGEPFLVCATRMGGQFGYGADGLRAPLGGVVSGFAKALAWERPRALIKVVDFAGGVSATEAAAQLLAETLHDPAVVEVGYRDGLRFGVGLAERPAGAANFELSRESVYVVSGGSGGISVPVVLDLANAAGGRFYLLGRTPLPDPADADLLALQVDRQAFKMQAAQKLRAQGEKATPAAVDARLASLERAAATLKLIAAAEQQGAQVEYRVCDVTDRQACEKTIRQVVAEAGRIDVFIHAAGVDHSRKLESKPPEEFRQTLAVKADGFFNLFKAMERAGQLPRAVVFFSSLTGRLGNSGQTDYCAANDLLGKLALALPAHYPGMKALALDWGAWAEVGMASRGYIPALMRRAGIDLLDAEEAAPLVRRELVHGPQAGEVLLAGSLGVLGAERRADGGLDLARANQALPEDPRRIQMDGFSLAEGLTLAVELDPTRESFLHDHALNGIPLLPGVIGIEGLARAACYVAKTLAADQDAFRVSGVEDVQFLAPLKFYRERAQRAIWKARVTVADDGLVAETRLESILTRYGREPEGMLHFTARVRLEPARQPVPRPVVVAPHWNGRAAFPAEEIYRLYFHGPTFRVLAAAQQTGGEVLGKFQTQLPPFTSRPQALVTAPLLVELCLQTAGVWEIGRTGALTLPRSIGSLKVYQPVGHADAFFAEVTPRERQEGGLSFDGRVVDERGRVYLELEDYRTTPLPYALEAGRLEPLRAWLSSTKG